MEISSLPTLTSQTLKYFFDNVKDADALLGNVELRHRALEAARLSTLPLGSSTVFVEFPLAGTSGFDLHVYPEIAHKEQRCRGDEETLSRHWPRYQNLFEWCAQYPTGVAETGYAFDLSSNANALDDPCLYTAFFEKDKSAVVPSMAMMDAAQFEPALRQILDALPNYCRVYYTGAMHGRSPFVAHVGYKVASHLVKRYNAYPDLLTKDLQKLGFSAQGDVMGDTGFLGAFEAVSPGSVPLGMRRFVGDIQFAFDEHGVIDKTLAFSYVSRKENLKDRVKSFYEGEQREVLEFLERQGIADNRWRLLDEAVGIHRVPVYAQGKVRMAAVVITVGFVKVRWADGKPCAPAKMYLSIKSVALADKGRSNA